MIEKWYITEQTFPELLNRNALRFGPRRAQWWKVEGAQRTATLTYAELWRLVKEAAAGLMELGFEKGDRGAVMAYTSPQWTWADYAVICAAGVSVSIYPTLSAKEVVYMLNDSGAKYLFVHDKAILERVIKARGQMGTLQKIVLLSGDNISGSPDVLTFEELRRLGVKLLSRQRLAFEKRWRSVELFYLRAHLGIDRIHAVRTV
jgi:long-chain acyl-CoA synthetase